MCTLTGISLQRTASLSVIRWKHSTLICRRLWWYFCISGFNWTNTWPITVASNTQKVILNPISSLIIFPAASSYFMTKVYFWLLFSRKHTAWWSLNSCFSVYLPYSTELCNRMYDTCTSLPLGSNFHIDVRLSFKSIFSFQLLLTCLTLCLQTNFFSPNRVTIDLNIHRSCRHGLFLSTAY